MPNRIRAFLTVLLLMPSCQTRAAAIPIKVKRVVQTGAKSQFGGLKDGLLTVAYQVSMDEAVAIPPMEPSATQAIMLMISFTVRDGLFILYF